MENALPCSLCTQFCVGTGEAPESPVQSQLGFSLLALCSHTLLLLCHKKGPPSPAVPWQRRKGFHNSCVILTSQKCQCASMGMTLPGPHCWQQCWESHSDWVRIGFLYSLFVKLRLQHRKNCLLTGAKAAECSTTHPGPDHSSRGPRFPNHSFSFRATMNFHMDLGETKLPCPFSFCVAMDFCKTYLLGGLIWYLEVWSLALNSDAKLAHTKGDIVLNCIEPAKYVEGFFFK